MAAAVFWVSKVEIKEAIVGYLRTLKERVMHGLKSQDKLWSEKWQWCELWIDSRGMPRFQ